MQVCIQVFVLEHWSIICRKVCVATRVTLSSHCHNYVISLHSEADKISSYEPVNWFTDQRAEWGLILIPSKKKCYSFRHPVNIATPPYQKRGWIYLKLFHFPCLLVQTATVNIIFRALKRPPHKKLPFMFLWAGCSSLFKCSFWCRRGFYTSSCLLFTSLSSPAWPSIPTKSP